MKLKHLIALIALALGLASGGVGAQAIAGGNAGASGGDVHTLAGGRVGGGGDAPAIAGGGVRTGDPLASIKPGQGDFETEAGGPAIAGGRGGMSGDLSY
jgi:hypothetical protein